VLGFVPLGREQTALERVGDLVLALGRLPGRGGGRERLLGFAATGDVLDEPARSVGSPRSSQTTSPRTLTTACSPSSRMSRTSLENGRRSAIAASSARRARSASPGRTRRSIASTKGSAASSSAVRESIRNSCSEPRITPVERSISQLPISASRSSLVLHPLAELEPVTRAPSSVELQIGAHRANSSRARTGLIR
jgi:hypothetical protein